MVTCESFSCAVVLPSRPLPPPHVNLTHKRKREKDALWYDGKPSESERYVAAPWSIPTFRCFFFRCATAVAFSVRYVRITSGLPGVLIYFQSFLFFSADISIYTYSIKLFLYFSTRKARGNFSHLEVTCVMERRYFDSSRSSCVRAGVSEQPGHPEKFKVAAGVCGTVGAEYLQTRACQIIS